MDVNGFFTRKRLLFVLLFAFAALIADQIRIFGLLGGDSTQFFTLFQFFAPVAGGFLGAAAGAISIILAQGASFLLGKELSIINIVRLFPMALAAVYFAKYKDRGNFAVAVPIICMLLFWLHPQGAASWFFALYWLIPVAAFLAPTDNLVLRSLGATFTAHAVGSTVWLYSFNTPAAVWGTLVPMVALERLLFALGIAGSFVVLNTVLDLLASKSTYEQLAPILQLDSRYSLLKRFG